MVLSTYTEVFWVGFAGGCLLELLHWYALKREPLFPDYAKRAKYWVTSALMAAAGGGLVVLYFGARAEAIVALHIGISAPLILQKLASAAFEPNGARLGGASIWTFFRW